MELQGRIISHFTDSVQIQQDTMANLCELIEYASLRVLNALLNDKKILACGNGRSAYGAQMLASILLSQFDRDRPSLPVLALATDAATLTGVANHHELDNVFAKQVRALGQGGDVLVVYVDNGDRPNVAKAIAAAHDKELSVIALTGLNGDRVSSWLREADIEICVPAQSAMRIHETHVLITHCLCDLIDHQLFG